MSFGRGGPRVWVPWWLLPIALVVYAVILVVIAPFWLLGRLLGAGKPRRRRRR
jgi:hypothetical protein